MRNGMMRMRSALAAALVTFIGFSQAPEVGEDAPSFELQAWALLGKGEKEPTPESLKGKVVLLEFWGTWCGPCVRAMPRIQALHDRFKNRGLKVLGISYEGLDVTKPFCEKNGFTFTLGSDPAKRVVEAYGVKSWPTSVVIGKDGKVAHVGNPYDVERAVEAALGLETDPPKVLTAALEALASKDKKRIADDLGRIASMTSLELDLKAWAIAAGGSGEEGATEPKGFESETEFVKVVRAVVAKDEAKKKASLDLLAKFATEEFDAVPWAKRVFGKEAPITKVEFTELLRSQRYDEAVDALYLRSPPGAVTAAAASDKGLKEYSAKKASDARIEAKKALMCLDYAFKGPPPRNNDDFWKELAVSGIRTSEDRKRVTGILLGDGDATPSNAAFYIECHLARAHVMESLAAGKEPPLASLPDRITKDRDQLRKQLAKKYGPDDKP